MMSPQEVRNITFIFNQFISTESGNTWEKFDDHMSYLEYLTDSELIVEASAMLLGHSQGTVSCGSPCTTCSVPHILDAVGSILELQNTTKNLHPNNKYILQFYLTISQLGEIVVE